MGGRSVLRPQALTGAPWEAGNATSPPSSCCSCKRWSLVWEGEEDFGRPRLLHMIEIRMCEAVTDALKYTLRIPYCSRIS